MTTPKGQDARGRGVLTFRLLETHVADMSTLSEIKAALPGLSPADLVELNGTVDTLLRGASAPVHGARRRELGSRPAQAR